MEFEKYVYYDETSPSGLRWSVSKIGKNGRIYTGAGEIAGTLDKRRNQGYWRISLCGKSYSAHRIILCILKGHSYFDNWVCDHLDGNRSNNIISNLRKVDHSTNSKNKKAYKNNTSGYHGIIYRTKKNHRYTYWAAVYVGIDNKRHEKAFSIEIYGNAAKELANNWRIAKIKELKSLGVGYTDRHGQ